MGRGAGSGLGSLTAACYHGAAAKAQGCSACVAGTAPLRRAAFANSRLSRPMTRASAAANDATGPSRIAIDRALRDVLVDVLGLDAERVAGFDHDTGLFGHLPELDSMAVATLLTEIEDRLHLTIEDDEVEGEMLESYGALLAFVEAKAVMG